MPQASLGPVEFSFSWSDKHHEGSSWTDTVLEFNGPRILIEMMVSDGPNSGRVSHSRVKVQKLFSIAVSITGSKNDFKRAILKTDFRLFRKLDWSSVVGDYRFPDSPSGRLAWVLGPFRKASLLGELI